MRKASTVTTPPRRSSWYYRWRVRWPHLLSALGVRGGLSPVVEPADGVHAELIPATEQAARYLHAQIRPDGSFVYRIDAVSGREDIRRYNVLRHAGSVLVLAQYARSAGFAEGDAERLMRAARFLVDHCIRAPQAAPRMLAVWSDPELNGGRRRYPVAKLGGNGLVLAALVELQALRHKVPHPALDDALPIEGLRALGEFVCLLQRADGSFQSLFSDVKRPAEHAWTSLYYPGQAALGLIMLYEIDPNPRWLQAAVRALRYLAVSRAGQSPPPDHWALIATARLFDLSETVLQACVPEQTTWRSADAATTVRAVRDTLISHAEDVCATFLSEQFLVRRGNCPAGWFGPEPRIAPTATRLEGLLAASTLPLSALQLQRIRPAIALGLRFLLDGQLQSGPAAGGFSRTCLSCVRASDRRATEVRIDYVQHALAAFQARLQLK